MKWNQTNTNEFDDVLSLFENADAETSAGAIPPGKYQARLVNGNLDKAKTGTACFCLKWEITQGEYQGRNLISRHWLSAKAIGRTKGVLLELGIGGEHLRGACPLPEVTAEISVVNRADDAGDLYQEIRRIRKIDDTTSVDGTHGANGAGAMSIRKPEANVAHDAGETISGDDVGAVAYGADDFLDAEYGG